MAKSVKVSLLLGGDYDRTRALRDGRVTADGVDLEIDLLERPHDVFHTLCHTDRYDGGELSLSFFSTIVSKHGPNAPFVGLPVYLSRMFRHGNILVNARTSIKEPRDLEGRSLALPEYGMTMAVWLRGILAHEHGVKLDRIAWRTGRDPVALGEEAVRYPANMDIKRGGEQKQLVRMLSEGKFDAYIGPAPNPLPPDVARLFPDYAERERAYYLKTSIFPIMHVLVLRREAHARAPHAAKAVYKAFCDAKELAIAELWNSSALRVSLPFLLPVMEEQTRLFGGDLWSYGLDRNRKTIDSYLTYAHEQGLLWHGVSADELFPDSVLAWAAGAA